MSKQTTTRHRRTGTVHALYALAGVACLAWVVLLFLDAPGRLAAGAFTLTNVLPLVAYVVDVIHTNESQEDR